MQHVGEKEVDTLEIHVYAGADGEFTLYDDEGDGYNYEHGKYSETVLYWNDGARELTIGNRSGKFPGMKENVYFSIRIIDEKGMGNPKVVLYTGEGIRVD
jgi:alpha-D-xyloside xylohydrolase